LARIIKGETARSIAEKNNTTISIPVRSPETIDVNGIINIISSLSKFVCIN
jgi:hypothetical protein